MSNKSNKKFDFTNNFDNIFESTDPADKLKGKSIVNISIEKLVPFKNHPFKLYEGERFADMVESVKENGIIIPIIIRPLDSEMYEILSGHNRIEAAKSVGLETVPAVIRENLSDDEALLIVTETNLRQRGFESLSHSERAAALAGHHEAIKHQGKRTDLINDIENLLKNTGNISSNAENENSAHIGRKLESREKVGQQYGLSKNSVARYLRINKLPEFFKNYLDENKIVFLAAVELSYMGSQNQEDLSKILLDNPKLKVDIKKAELLREFSENNKLTPEKINDILAGVALKKRNRASLPVQSLKLKGKVLSKYFKPEDKPEEIEAELIEALEFYREYKKSSKI